METFNGTDVRGCEYTMNVLAPYFNTNVEWYHTSTDYNLGEYCHYDMVWRMPEKRKRCAVENKDRRWKWKDGVCHYSDPQYYDDYYTIMCNVDKIEKNLKLWETDNLVPLFTSDYTDGVFLLDLRRLPKDWKDRWVKSKKISKTTLGGGEKKEQERVFIPKSFGWFYPADSTQPVQKPTYKE